MALQPEIGTSVSRSRVLRPSRRRAAALALVATGALVLLTSAGVAQAVPAQTTFVNQSFTGTTAGTDFVKPIGPITTNGACLTAATSTAPAPLPGCGGVPDADGSGALRLTDGGQLEAGAVSSTVSIPMSHGLDATFDTYQYSNAPGADGMTFFLAAADPANPQVPAALGQLGGSLGYSDQDPAEDGLTDGYLGLGIDAYGNFPTPGFGSPSCAAGTQSPNSISVRGPGNGRTGYCNLEQHVVTAGALRASSATRSSADVVPVEVVVNPSASATNALGSGAPVPAHSYAVIVTAIGSGGTNDVLTGALPSTLNGEIPAGLYDSSWVNPSTGYPYTLTFGWSAGTGGLGDNHEVTNATATTLLGPLPVLVQATTGSGSVRPGASSVVAIQGSVASTGGSEIGPVEANAVFPTGFVPSDGSDSAWHCVITGQTETCTFTPTTAVASGATLPTLSLPYLSSAIIGSSTIATSLASAESPTATGFLAVTDSVLPTRLPTTGSSIAVAAVGSLGVVLLLGGALLLLLARRETPIYARAIRAQTLP